MDEDHNNPPIIPPTITSTPGSKHGSSSNKTNNPTPKSKSGGSSSSKKKKKKSSSSSTSGGVGGTTTTSGSSGSAKKSKKRHREGGDVAAAAAAAAIKSGDKIKIKKTKEKDGGVAGGVKIPMLMNRINMMMAAAGGGGGGVHPTAAAMMGMNVEDDKFEDAQQDMITNLDTGTGAAASRHLHEDYDYNNEGNNPNPGNIAAAAAAAMMMQVDSKGVGEEDTTTTNNNNQDTTTTATTTITSTNEDAADNVDHMDLDELMACFGDDATTTSENKKSVLYAPFQNIPIYGEHKRAVSSVELAKTRITKNRPNSIICASASSDGSVKIWDLATATRNLSIQDCLGIPSAQSALASGNNTKGSRRRKGGAGGKGGGPQGQKIPGRPSSTTISSSSGSIIHRYAIDPTVTLVGHSRGINDVTWSPNAPLIATASDDKTLRLWDATALSSSSVAAAAAADGGEPMAAVGTTSAGIPGTAATSNNTEALVEFRGHDNFVFCCKIYQNLLVSGSFDETVKLWDIRNGECIATLPVHSDPVTAVSFNRDGTCVVSASHDGLIRIWDVATGECLKTIFANGNPPVSHVTYSPNGKYVLASTLDSKLRLWPIGVVNHYFNPKTNATTQQQAPNSNHHPTNAAICSKTYYTPSSPDTTNTTTDTTATAAANPSATDTTTTTSAAATAAAANNNNNNNTYVNTKYCIVSTFLTPLRNRPQCILTGSENGNIVLFDVNSKKIHQVLKGHTDAVLAVDAHDTREFIVSGGMTSDKTVQFWAPKKRNY